MTISTNDQTVDMKKFNESFDRIFGKEEGRQTGRYIRDPETGKYVPCETMSRDLGRVNAPMVMRPMEDFVSPIDNSVISSREQLAAHNKKHGVTNVRDYGEGYVERKAHERVAQGEKYLNETRRVDINDAINQHTR